MKYFTARAQIREVADRYEKAYRLAFFDGPSTAQLQRLRALDLEKATPEEVSAILPNWLGTACNECGQYSLEYVRIGEEPDYERSATCLCPDCVKEAYERCFPRRR